MGHSRIAEISIPSQRINLNESEITYVMFLLDDYSAYLTVHLLAYKSEATAHFIEFDRKLFNRTTRHFTTFRSDSGGGSRTKECSITAVSMVLRKSLRSASLASKYTRTCPLNCDGRDPRFIGIIKTIRGISG